MNRSQPTARRPIRAGIVGAGQMGRWHAHALVRAGGRLVAVADAHPAAAQRLAQAYRARAFTSAVDLLADAPVDALHICTPLATHADLAAGALDAGAHVLVEKPLAPDAGATARLIAQAQARHRHLIPVHQFLFQRGVQAALRRLPDLTPLVHLEVTAATAGGAGLEAAGLDRLVADILPHPLALFQRFRPEGLDGIEWSVGRPAAGELRALGLARSLSLAIHISTRGRPTRNLLDLIGEQGSSQVDLFHGFAVFERGRVSRAQKIWRPFGQAARTLTAATANLAWRTWQSQPAYPGLQELIQAFYQAIHHGTPPPISAKEILAVARARDRLLEGIKD